MKSQCTITSSPVPPCLLGCGFWRYLEITFWAMVCTVVRTKFCHPYYSLIRKAAWTKKLNTFLTIRIKGLLSVCKNLWGPLGTLVFVFGFFPLNFVFKFQFYFFFNLEQLSVVRSGLIDPVLKFVEVRKEIDFYLLEFNCFMSFKNTLGDIEHCLERTFRCFKAFDHTESVPSVGSFSNQKVKVLK